MSNTDRKDTESGNTELPNPIPEGSPTMEPILENSVTRSNSARSIEEKGNETDENEDGMKNSAMPDSNSSIEASSKSNKEIKGSVCGSAEKGKKRQRFEDEAGEKEDGINNSNLLIGSSSNSNENNRDVEIEGSAPEPTNVAEIQRAAGEGINEDSDGFTTPTDPAHKIPFPTTCPPKPRKPRWTSGDGNGGERPDHDDGVSQ